MRGESIVLLFFNWFDRAAEFAIGFGWIFIPGRFEVGFIVGEIHFSEGDGWEGIEISNKIIWSLLNPKIESRFARNQIIKHTPTAKGTGG